MKSNDRRPTDAPYHENRFARLSPTLIQTGNMAMLLAIFLSVAPGIDLGAATLGVALVGLVFYAVEAFGGVYDGARAVAREVRA